MKLTLGYPALAASAVAMLDGVHFERIGTALDAAREDRIGRGELVSAACRITIEVASGQGSALTPASGNIEHFPLLVDVPDITLIGALTMQIDDSGRATGQGSGSGATTLTPVEPLPILAGASTPLIVVNGHPGGSADNGLAIPPASETPSSSTGSRFQTAAVTSTQRRDARQCDARRLSAGSSAPVARGSQRPYATRQTPRPT